MTAVPPIAEIVIDSILRLIGAFYVFGGIVATRAAVASHLMDRALAAISGELPSLAERARMLWLMASSTIVFVGGVMLMLLLEESRWIFLVSAVGQLCYLYIMCPLAFDAADPPDPAGRRATRNAAFLYCIVTALIFWAEAAHLLRPHERWSDTVVGVAAVGFLGWLGLSLRSITQMARSPETARSAIEEAETLKELEEIGASYADEPMPGMPPPRSVKLQPSIAIHPLQSLDPNWIGDVLPDDIALAHELALEIEAWVESYQGLIDRDGNPLPSGLVRLGSLDADGRRLAQKIADAAPATETHYQPSTGPAERIHPVRKV